MRSHIAFAAALGAFALAAPGDAATSMRSAPDRPRHSVRPSIPREVTPRFVENAGQWGEGVSFAAAGDERRLLLGPRSMKYSQRGAVVEFAFDGGGRVAPRGASQARAMHHYFRGSATAVHARTFSSVVYDGAWRGVDLRFDARPSAVEYSLVVHPGADASAARFLVRGATRVATTADGALDVTTSAGSMTHSRPIAWQDRDGERAPVAVEFDVGPRDYDGTWTYGFSLGAHDPRRAVTIDPSFAFRSVFDVGGEVRTITADATGHVFVAGRTLAAEADIDPGAGTYDTTVDGSQDAWIARFDAGGDLLWATYLGGSPDAADAPDSDEPTGIAVTEDGDVVAVGTTSSSGFPQAGAPFLGAHLTGAQSPWIARLSGDGATLLHGGLLGGRGAAQLAAGPGGDAYVAWTPGTYESAPVTDVVPAANGPGVAVTWIARLARDGAPARVTELRGSAPDAWTVSGFAVDAEGAAHLSGTVLEGAALPSAAFSNAPRGGGTDAFSMKLDPGGAFLEHALAIGGDLDDAGGALVLDSAGSEHIVGSTMSSPAAFPRRAAPGNTTPPYDRGRAFVAVVPSAPEDGVAVTELGTRDYSASISYELYGIGIDASDVVLVTVFGQMWRLDPHGFAHRYTGTGGPYFGRPVPVADGVVWFGWVGLYRVATEELRAPYYVRADALSTDFVALQWTLPGAHEAIVVERAKGLAPLADVATVTDGAPFFHDSGGIEPDTTYRYRVRAITGGVESVRSRVESVRTPGLLQLLRTRSRVADRESAHRDAVRARGRFMPLVSDVPEFDPAVDAVRVTVGRSFSLEIPAGDAGWTIHRGRYVWTGAVHGGEATLRIDASRRKFRIAASGMTLPRPVLAMPQVTLRIGSVSGWWTAY